jgi:hypothetical protein
MYKDGHQILQGSGFLISKDGDVVTNYHVIKNGSKGVIKLPNATRYDIDGVLASDRDRDVAIIKAHGSDFRTLALGDSRRLEVGEEVVAIGNPLSLESTVSNGIVSAIRFVEGEGGTLVQITAPISPGSSGGPLFNMAGEVVGITTSHIEGGQNLNFAIPINDAKRILTTTSSKVSALPNEPDPDTVTSEQTTGPSLADTLRWIKTSSGEFPGVESRTASFHTYMYIFAEDSSCQDFGVFINIIQEGATKRASKFVYLFNLGDVDPDSIHQKSGMILFGVTDDQSKIKLKREVALDQDHLKSGDLISSDDLTKKDAAFFVDNDDYRNRLEKAFKHAVILCGGKPSTF